MGNTEEREPLMFVHLDSIGNENACYEHYDNLRIEVIKLVADENKGRYWQGMVIHHSRQGYEDLHFFDSTRTPPKYPFLYFSVQCEDESLDGYIVKYMDKIGLSRI